LLVAVIEIERVEAGVAVDGLEGFLCLSQNLFNAGVA
jgi:hypothetical protein